jgi:hypothetical protein
MLKLGMLAICGFILLCWIPVSAQVPPFFSAGAAAFEPQIGIVNSGVVQDAQAVVSHDLKYVTLNMQVQNSNLLALQEFTFQKLPSLGVVGLPQTIVPDPKNARRNAPAAAPFMTSPSEIKRLADSWVLERQGMFRVADAP